MGRAVSRPFHGDIGTEASRVFAAFRCSVYPDVDVFFIFEREFCSIFVFFFFSIFYSFA